MTMELLIAVGGFVLGLLIAGGLVVSAYVQRDGGPGEADV